MEKILLQIVASDFFTYSSIIIFFSMFLIMFHRYHGYNACNNIFYTQSNEIVFHTAALGIVYSPKTHEQRFYFGHDDDVLCLTIHDDQDFVATGQVIIRRICHIWMD